MENKQVIPLIVSRIIDDLNDRSGFDLYGLDSATRQEIINDWESIISNTLIKEIKDEFLHQGINPNKASAIWDIIEFLKK